MRSDMSRKVIERPRAGGLGNSAIRSERRRKDYDDMPKYESTRKTHKKHYANKSLTDNLKPLYRYLDKQIGRPWDKVQSEMMSVLDMRDHIQAHIFEHIDGRIAIKCQRAPLHESKTGLVYHGAFTQYYNTRVPVGAGQLYVCPETGIIKRAKLKLKPKKVKQNDTIRKIDDKNIAVKLDSIWYRIELAECTEEKRWIWLHSAEVHDENIGNSSHGYYRTIYHVNGEEKTYITYAEAEFGSHFPRYHSKEKMKIFPPKNKLVAVKRTQMNSKELRRLQLKNG